MMAPVGYFRIAEGEPLPDLEPMAPYRAVVVLAADYGSDWQNQVSDWLVRTGCLYMMAWGPNCSSWDDSVDWSSLAEFEFEDIPEDRFVMTTWHENEPLDEVFWFAGSCAYHPVAEIEHTVILHVSLQGEEEDMLRRFRAAQNRY